MHLELLTMSKGCDYKECYPYPDKHACCRRYKGKDTAVQHVLFLVVNKYTLGFQRCLEDCGTSPVALRTNSFSKVELVGKTVDKVVSSLFILNTETCQMTSVQKFSEIASKINLLAI